MCLDTVTDNFDLLKKCKKSSILKNGMVGYKIFRMSELHDGEIYFEGMYYGGSINCGWVKKSSYPKILTHYHMQFGERSYTAGCHVFFSKKDAMRYLAAIKRESSSEDKTEIKKECVILPVHFLGRDVTNIGDEYHDPENVAEIEYAVISVMVLKKYLLRKEDYRKTALKKGFIL